MSDRDQLKIEQARRAREFRPNGELQCTATEVVAPRPGEPYEVRCDLPEGHLGPHAGMHPVRGRNDVEWREWSWVRKPTATEQLAATQDPKRMADHVADILLPRLQQDVAKQVVETIDVVFTPSVRALEERMEEFGRRIDLVMAKASRGLQPPIVGARPLVKSLHHHAPPEDRMHVSRDRSTEFDDEFTGALPKSLVERPPARLDPLVDTSERTAHLLEEAIDMVVGLGERWAGEKGWAEVDRHPGTPESPPPDRSMEGLGARLVWEHQRLSNRAERLLGVVAKLQQVLWGSTVAVDAGMRAQRAP